MPPSSKHMGAQKVCVCVLATRELGAGSRGTAWLGVGGEAKQGNGEEGTGVGKVPARYKCEHEPRPSPRLAIQMHKPMRSQACVQRNMQLNRGGRGTGVARVWKS